MDLNPQAKSNSTGRSNTSKDDKLMVPTSNQLGSDVQQIGAKENLYHTITSPEPPSCRICVAEEEVEDGNTDDLIELRCSCKGHMSMMHRNCILKWYGLRMILNKRLKCEICNTVLHPATQLVVEQAVSDRENQGRDILLKALASELASYGFLVDLESAATYEELVDLIHNTDPRRDMLRQIFVDARRRRRPHVGDDQPPPQRGQSACHRVAVVVVLGITAIAAVLYLILVFIFHGKDAIN